MGITPGVAQKWLNRAKKDGLATGNRWGWSPSTE